MTPHLLHRAAFIQKLTESVSFAEGARVEPLVIGLQAAARAKIQPGDTALVTGAGPIGVLTAFSVSAGGAAKVFISDISFDKLAIAEWYPGLIPIHLRREEVVARLAKDT